MDQSLGHTNRNDFLFPAQQQVDDSVGQLPSCQLAQHEVWESTDQFFLRNGNGQLVQQFIKQHVQKKCLERHLKNILQQHPERGKWTSHVQWPDMNTSWRVRWLGQQIRGVVRWPYMYARENGLAFATRDPRTPVDCRVI